MAINRRGIKNVPLLGRTETFHEEDDEFIHNTKVDIEPILKLNEAQLKESDGTYRGDGFHHVARIPMVLWGQLQSAGILDDPRRFKAWLDDPAQQPFRTHPGRLGTAREPNE